MWCYGSEMILPLQTAEKKKKGDNKDWHHLDRFPVADRTE